METANRVGVLRIDAIALFATDLTLADTRPWKPTYRRQLTCFHGTISRLECFRPWTAIESRAIVR